MIERFNATAPPRPGVEIEVVAWPATELLIGLYALTVAEPRPSHDSWVPAIGDCSQRLRRLIDQVGSESGELWLHLLGLALESPDRDAAAFAARLSGIDALEFRRELVGVHCPPWVGAVGAETLERAADGDVRAAAVLLADPCYYGGHAPNALAALLPLSATKTKQRVVAIVDQFVDEIFSPREEMLLHRLRAEAMAQQPKIDTARLTETVSAVTGGYDYRAETDVASVTLIPHLAAPPWVLLCQHRSGRLICYPAGQAFDNPEHELRERILRLGRTLSDEKRVEIVRRLAHGEATLNDLVEHTGLAKSTVHHHVAQLRAAGLLVVHGNARNYSYSLSKEGFRLSLAALRDMFGSESGGFSGQS
jgi:DNA-binding transcriptional ArsR family regulator